MSSKLFIAPPPENYNPILKEGERTWWDYNITEEEIQKHPWLEKIKHIIENTGWSVKINKDKTQLCIYNSFGDEQYFDIKIGKMIDYAMGF